MSGIVGIVNLDGVPLDQTLLDRMTQFMAFRGPDVQDTWVDDQVGFGHAMLRTTEESSSEKQPVSLDGKVWITADARVDARADLIQKLECKGNEKLKFVTDAELILHAYHTWGEDCVKHLMGDFAFAIWDGNWRRLFCARDHLGIKPFYYAHKQNRLIFSNTLKCLRLHPIISDTINELAIGDFLLFDFNQDSTTTTFTDIKRLPPAHYLIWSNGKLLIENYWNLPVDGHIQYRRSEEYIDHFKELLRQIVSDRLRNNQIVVFMSGGMDSTSVAATAYQILSEKSTPFNLQALTMVYDQLIPDRERYYSGIASEGLNIPINYLVSDKFDLYDRWDQPELLTPEPNHNPVAAMSFDQLKQVKEHSRVVLTGYGGDNGFYLHPARYIIGLLGRLKIDQAVSDLVRLIYLKNGIHRLGLRTMIKKWLKIGNVNHDPPYPTWLNVEFENRLNLKRRWREINKKPLKKHTTRSEVYETFITPFLQYAFEGYDPGITSVPVEIRYPFFDIRLISYLLSIPPIPWCIDKHLLREAMRGILPDEIRVRPKTPLAGYPILELFRHPQADWVNHFNPQPDLLNYIDRYAIPKISKDDSYDQIWVNLRPISLNFWLQHNSRRPKNI